MADQGQSALGIGDVLCTRGNTFLARLIRFGAALHDQENIGNHVAVVHHKDAKGEWVCIEGRPGGVGPAPAAKYIASPFTINNVGQPKTDLQRAQIAKAMESLVGVGYDWAGIALDTFNAVGIDIPDKWKGTWDHAHVVCSSAADWAYEHVGMASPGRADRTQETTPADWIEWSLRNRYHRPLT